MTTPSIVAVDATDEAAIAQWRRVVDVAMSVPPAGPRADERLAGWFPHWRLWAGVDGDAAVATFADREERLALPGSSGAPVVGDSGLPSVLATLVSAVTVLPSHRRRGLLTRWMTGALAAARERGVPVASLVASEAPIYGRFGFGLVVEHEGWSVDVRRAAVRADERCPAHGEHAVGVADGPGLVEVLPEVYERARVLQPTAAPRLAADWPDLVDPDGEGASRRRFALVHRPADGSRVDGYALVAVRQHWRTGSPASTAVVEDSAAVDARVATCLWRSVLSLDLVETVEAWWRPLGEPVPEVCRDRRAATVAERNDAYWWRLLDVPAVLSARGWSGSGRLAIEVVDPLGLAGGRWHVDVDEAGRAAVTPTTREADLTVPVDALAGVGAGERSPLRLQTAGQLDEHRHGAAATLDRLARTTSLARVPYHVF